MNASGEVNTPIQGSAAEDIVQLAMITLQRRLRKQGLVAQLVLQVHDELVLEIHKDVAIEEDCGQRRCPYYGVVDSPACLECPDAPEVKANQIE